MTLKGKSVIGKVWIHYIIGDTVGNNRWTGHYANGKGCPCRDCVCPFTQMSDPNPQCVYVTPEDIEAAEVKKSAAHTKTEDRTIMSALSKHDINNSSMQRVVALSDT